MNDDAGGLVDDNDVVILEQDIECGHALVKKMLQKPAANGSLRALVGGDDSVVFVQDSGCSARHEDRSIGAATTA
jgi:hypothetical protein